MNPWKFHKLTDKEKLTGDIYREINNLISRCTQNNWSDENFIEADANLIVNNIWLGNVRAAQDFNFVTSKKINHIINASDKASNIFTFLTYTTYPIIDKDVCYQNMVQLLQNGAKTINDIVNSNNIILIHCKNGHHRSASMLAFYFMTYHNMSLPDAIDLIKKYRPTAFRRMTCMLNALIKYEISRKYNN